MHRHEAAALQVDLRDHLALARDEFARQHFRHFFERDLVPSMQANRLGAHGPRAYTKTSSKAGLVSLRSCLSARLSPGAYCSEDAAPSVGAHRETRSFAAVR